MRKTVEINVADYRKVRVPIETSKDRRRRDKANAKARPQDTFFSDLISPGPSNAELSSAIDAGLQRLTGSSSDADVATVTTAPPPFNYRPILIATALAVAGWLAWRYRR
jgi:hypothetical protein